MEYLKNIYSLITSDARGTRGNKPGIAVTKAALEHEESFHPQIGLKFKEKIIKLLNLEHSFVLCWKLDTSETRS